MYVSSLHSSLSYGNSHPDKSDRILTRLVHSFFVYEQPSKVAKLISLYLGSPQETDGLSKPIFNSLFAKPKSTPLLTMVSARSASILSDARLSSEPPMHAFIMRCLDLPESCLDLLRLIIRSIISRGKQQAVVELNQLFESIARDSKHLNKVYLVLIDVAVDPIWKAYSLENKLQSILLSRLDAETKGDWISEDSLTHLCLFLQHATVMFDRSQGMNRLLPEQKEGQDYLFEDMPQESLLQDTFRRLEPIINSLLLRL